VRLPIALSTYYEQKTRQAYPGRLPLRAQRDARLRSEIRCVWKANWQVCGTRKTWLRLNRKGIDVVRRTVAQS